MMGEDDVEDISEGSFNSKSVWARMSVIVAGPLFNLILAWILCMIMIAWVGYRTPVVGGVIDGYSAQEQGLSEGDVITKIGGRSVHIWNDISLYNLTHSEEKKLRSHIRGMERRIQQCWSRDRKKEILHRFWE